MKNGSETVKAIAAELKARTQTEACTLKIQADTHPGLLDSKIGGLPYWDPRRPYPVDASGEKLFLLAQLNFDRLQAEEPLPQRGMLQFFIGQDDLFGMDCDRPDLQDGFRVVYHEHIDPSVTPERVRALDVPTHADVEYSPVCREAAVRMERAVSYMGPDDARFAGLFKAVVRDILGEDMGAQSVYRYLGSGDFGYLCGQLGGGGHRMLGYPFFTQSDPRGPGSPYDTLLFQLDSDSAGREDYVLWGDCGVANFFINRRDLENRDFTKVLYNWDCC